MELIKMLSYYLSIYFHLGVARGCGWQRIGAYINLGTYYFCGIPVAAILGFWIKLRGKGLWIGVQFGALVQTVLLFLVTSFTNWEKQVYICMCVYMYRNKHTHTPFN